MLSTAPTVIPFLAEGQVRPGDATFSLVLSSSALLAEFEARLLLDAAARGQDSVLICGDNRLDAYGLLARARAMGIEDALADGVHLARAFTLHQFVALVEETLPRMARETDASLALVTGSLDLFADEDVTEAEARVLLPRMMRRLGALAHRDMIVVATGDARSRHADLAREHAPHREISRIAPSARQPRLDAFVEVA
ncbi:MAG TPA: hypothetical protein VM370_11565 [Candidatus Thermoplasmatota archaeon]|nr:hypothetical protein [Candidatus Thermoplasmatota archaeon]